MPQAGAAFKPTNGDGSAITRDRPGMPRVIATLGRGAYIGGVRSPTDENAVYSTIEGAVDTILDNRIDGWVWDSSQDGVNLTVEVFGPDGFIAGAVADQYRADLAEVDKNHGYCAFSVTLPPMPPYDNFDALSVFVAGTELDLTGHGVEHPFRRGFDFANPSSRRLLAQQLHVAVTGQEANVVEIEAHARTLGEGVPGLVAILRGLREAVLAQAHGAAAARMAADAPTAAVAPAQSGAIVTGVFRGVFRREPEARALELYGPALESGMPLEAFISEMLATTEFAAKSSHGSAQANAGQVAEVEAMTRAMESAMLTLAMEAAAG